MSFYDLILISIKFQFHFVCQKEGELCFSIFKVQLAQMFFTFESGWKFDFFCDMTYCLYFSSIQIRLLKGNDLFLNIKSANSAKNMIDFKLRKWIQISSFVIFDHYSSAIQVLLKEYTFQY